MNRTIVAILFLSLLLGGNAAAQIACPAMGLTQVNVNKTNRLSGFSSSARTGQKNGRMADFFTVKNNGRSGFSSKDEFASRSKKKGRFRTYDEFATRSKRSKQFRDFDEFAYSRKTKRVTIDSQFAVRSTTKRFNKKKERKDAFKTKQKRIKQARREYTPFASSTSEFAGERKHRQPQMGLWGGTVGSRSGKDKRAMSPLPEPEKKKSD